MERSCGNCKHVKEPSYKGVCEECVSIAKETEYYNMYPKWEPKEMEFIKKYHIDAPPLTMTEEFTNGFAGSLTAIVEKVCAVSIEKHENILIDEIIKVAKENGITDLYLLNKDAIVEALSKQIPRAEKESYSGGGWRLLLFFNLKGEKHMLKKTVKYEDYNGVEKTKDFYFNLNKKDGCPRCHYDLKCDSYCPNCGQKILFDPETGYPVRED